MPVVRQGRRRRSRLVAVTSLVAYVFTVGSEKEYLEFLLLQLRFPSGHFSFVRWTDPA